MSTLHLDKTRRKVLMRGEPVELPASRSIVVPGMCYATIFHDWSLTTEPNEIVLLYRKPGVFIALNFIVDSGPVLSGPLQTVVFNLSNHSVKIRKGQSVSLLLAW